jgi:hypothetical protein
MKKLLLIVGLLFASDSFANQIDGLRLAPYRAIEEIDPLYRGGFLPRQAFDSNNNAPENENDPYRLGFFPRLGDDQIVPCSFGFGPNFPGQLSNLPPLPDSLPIQFLLLQEPDQSQQPDFYVPETITDVLAVVMTHRFFLRVLIFSAISDIGHSCITGNFKMAIFPALGCMGICLGSKKAINYMATVNPESSRIAPLLDRMFNKMSWGLMGYTAFLNLSRIRNLQRM